MGYEINVSHNGTHYFATAERSIGADIRKAKQIYQELKTLYPKDKGYKITVAMYSKIGNPIDMEEELLTGELTSGR